MTLLHVRKTQVHLWKTPRCGSMNGVSVGTCCLRLSRVDRVNSRTSVIRCCPNSLSRSKCRPITPSLQMATTSVLQSALGQLIGSAVCQCYHAATGLSRTGAELAGRKRDKKTEKSRIYVFRIRLGLDENCLLFGVQTAVSLR